jgi:hypothetical protein
MSTEAQITQLFEQTAAELGCSRPFRYYSVHLKDLRRFLATARWTLEMLQVARVVPVLVEEIFARNPKPRDGLLFLGEAECLVGYAVSMARFRTTGIDIPGRDVGAATLESRAGSCPAFTVTAEDHKLLVGVPVFGNRAASHELRDEILARVTGGTRAERKGKDTT